VTENLGIHEQNIDLFKGYKVYFKVFGSIWYFHEVGHVSTIHCN